MSLSAATLFNMSFCVKLLTCTVHSPLCGGPAAYARAFRNRPFA